MSFAQRLLAVSALAATVASVPAQAASSAVASASDSLSTSVESISRSIKKSSDSSSRTVVGQGDYKVIQVAQVELPVRDLLRGGEAPWHLRASTAVLADGWNASGSGGVRRAVQRHAAVQGALSGFALVGGVVSMATGLLEETTPVLPCFRVEAVPADRLTGAPSSPGACE